MILEGLGGGAEGRRRFELEAQRLEEEGGGRVFTRASGLGDADRGRSKKDEVGPLRKGKHDRRYCLPRQISGCGAGRPA